MGPGVRAVRPRPTDTSVGCPADPRAGAPGRAACMETDVREPAMPLLLAILLVGLLAGYLLAVVLPCPLRLSAALGGVAGLLAALALPGFSTL